jgi:FdhD protein
MASPGKMDRETRDPRSMKITHVTVWGDESARRVEDWLASEEPLEIRCGRQSLGVTMRTPGHDQELVAGLLFTDGIIRSPDQLVWARPSKKASGRSEQQNTIFVKLRGVKIPKHRAERMYSAGSACGVCGKASIDAVRQRLSARPETATQFDAGMLCVLPDRLRAEQDLFRHTGGLHAAALFNANGELVVLREDIGRHNAVDKVIGWAFLRKQIPLKGHLCLVSGRGGFEIVQKALMAGLPLLASVSAPSSLAVQVAREMRMSLVGFLRGNRFVIYSGEERIVSASAASNP